MRRTLASLSTLHKQLIIVPVDYGVALLCLWAALAVRLDSMFPVTFIGVGIWLAFLIPCATIFALRIFGVYRVSVRSLERRGVIRIAQASLLSGSILAASATYFPSVLVPRSTPIIFGFLLFVGLIAIRHLGREVYLSIVQPGSARIPVIIYGAGASGTQLAASLVNAREFRVVGFIDDDKALWGRLVAGQVVASPNALDRLLKRYSVREVLLAIPSATRSRRAEVLRFLSERPVHVRTIPALSELVSGAAAVDKLQEVDVDHLLDRESVEPIPELFEIVKNKVVLVTGAGGSIGSELCRQAAAKGARELILFEISEFALYQIELELRASFPSVSIVPVLGSVLDCQLLIDLLRKHAVDTLYHAAAYKHVPLVEGNAIEGVKNNALGTMSVANAAVEAKIPKAVLISTDKAVRPTNIMGASKRLAERIFASYQAKTQHTVFSMVRFGNVIGSSGSVIPLFQKQITEGGPVTVTHRDIIRYFMTIPEAAQLVIQASSLATGADLFLLDMGKPVSIVDLARRMISLSGQRVKDEFNPDGDIEITFTGLRPGEKLYEELLIQGATSPTSHPKIVRALDFTMNEKLEELVQELEWVTANRDSVSLIGLLQKFVEGYQPGTHHVTGSDVPLNCHPAAIRASSVSVTPLGAG